MSHLKKISRKLAMRPTNDVVMGGGPVLSKIQCDSPSVNTAQFTESSDVFTCTIPGVYWVSMILGATSANSGLYIYKNGANHRSYSSVAGSETSNIGWRLDFSVPVELAVGDTISFYVYVASSITTVTTSESVIVLELL